MSDNSYGTTFGPSAPGAINLVSGDTGGVDMTHTANSPSSTGPNADLTARRQGRLLADRRRAAVLRRLLHPRRGRRCPARTSATCSTPGLSWGWFQGGFRPTTPTPRAHRVGAGQPTSTFIPDQFKAGFRPGTHAANQGICNAVHPVGVSCRVARHRHRPVRVQGRLHPAPRAVPVLRLDRQPAPPDVPTTRPGHAAGLDDRHRHPVLCGGVPQFNTPNHQYDIERLRPAGRRDRQGRAAPTTARGAASSRRRAARTGTPPTPTRSTSSTSSSTRSTRWRRPRTGSHRGRHLLRRLRRLVRPRVLRRDQPVHLGSQRRPHRRRRVRHAAPRWRARTAAAATARGCRCWSSRPGRRPTTSTTR